MSSQLGNEKPTIDDLITTVMLRMATLGVETTEYQKLLDLLERLTNLKPAHKRERRWNINPDIVVQALGTLAGILVIVSYEHMHVMTSKGLDFIKKN